MAVKLVDRFPRVAVVVALGAALAACGSTAVTQADLQKRPEAHLFHPGSHLRMTTGQSEQLTAAGTTPAVVTNELSDTASIDEIYSWYVKQLTAKGWTLQEQKRVDGSYDLFTRGDREVFQVGIASSPGTYTTRLSMVPAPCATSPPTIRAFANCA